jgi:uncharacterized LabA/DUF88 family protein
MNESSVAVLWDAENINPKTVKSLVDTVAEYASRYGRLSVAYAFGDWTRTALKGADDILARASFQLVHIPGARKNSADISMVTSGMELLFLYPHVSTYVLVTGDSDFRPLLTSMRRRGAATAIICDAKSASEDLLTLCDHYQDYRDLMLDEEGEDASDKESQAAASLTKEQAFALLSEAVGMMEQRGKTPTLGPVKIRLRLLNEEFDEGQLGYRSWKAFVLDARSRGYVDIENRETDLVLSVPRSRKTRSGELSEPFVTFVKTVHDGTKGQSGGDVPFPTVSNLLRQAGFDFRQYGYNKFKKLAEAAEKRGLVELSNRGLEWYIKLTSNGKRLAG